MKRKTGSNRYKWIMGIGLAIFAFLMSLRLGSMEMTASEFIKGILRQKGYESASFVLLNLRLPRAAAAYLAGIGLSVAGLTLQNLTGNDLAGPNIIGVNAGAGFLVILSMFFFEDLYRLTPLFAFLGALAAAVLIMAIGGFADYRRGTMILAGVAVTSLLNAGISLISLLDTDILSKYNDFAIGGLYGASMERLALPALMIAVSVICLLILSKDVDALTLGDDIARSVGVNAKRTRFLAAAFASACAGAVVSFAGLLGFVGLMVPHMARRIFGYGTKNALLGSALTGMIIVPLADVMGRSMFKGTEIPVGIVMAFAGVPFFLYLVFRRRAE